MSQLTFAEAEYEAKKRKTRRELFLERMVGEEQEPAVPGGGAGFANLLRAAPYRPA